MQTRNRACFLLALFLSNVVASTCFEFMADWKLPKLKFREKKDVIAASKFGNKRICVITGTSSGLGKQTAKQLLEKGDYYVIGAVRDVEKMETVAELENFDKENFKIMKCDLGSFQSVRDFTKNLLEFTGDKPIDRLACNAAVYQPSLPEAKWSEDGLEQQLQTNFLSHFLLTSLLIPRMKEAEKARVIMVGSVTGNDNTVGGGGVYPIADLREMEGLAQGGKRPIAMIDGRNFNGAKAYKDTKLCLMMLSNFLHEKYHRNTGISFNSIYPGCIAESPLFREKRPWFRKYFPLFMRYVTGGYVGEQEAGSRLYQALVDPRCSKSGVYWSWNGGPREGRGMEAVKNGGQIVGAGGEGGGWESIFENDQSDKVRDIEKARQLFEYSTKITGAEWPLAKAPKSPCPTLKVISFVTSILDKQEEKKMKPKTMKEAMENWAM